MRLRGVNGARAVARSRMRVLILATAALCSGADDKLRARLRPDAETADDGANGCVALAFLQKR